HDQCPGTYGLALEDILKGNIGDLLLRLRDRTKFGHIGDGHPGNSVLRCDPVVSVCACWGTSRLILCNVSEPHCLPVIGNHCFLPIPLRSFASFVSISRASSSKRNKSARVS